MFGLIVLVVIGLYLLISVGVVRWAISYAKKNGKSAKRWGWGAALGMYMLVFWDWIPTVVAHKYYCATEAGFWVYKSVDQWKKENPGVMEGLVANKGAQSTREGNMDNFTDTYFLNERINKVVKFHGKFLFNRWRHEEEVIDTKTNEVLARYVDFYTAQMRGGGGWSGWKFWLHNSHCARDANSQYDSQELREQFVELEVQLNGREK